MNALIDAFPVNLRHELNVQRDSCVFLQGDACVGIFVVRQGTIQLQRHSKAGATVVIHTAKQGSTFAEASLFSAVYHCDAVALEPSVVVRLDKAGTLDRIKADPAFAAVIIQQFGAQIQSYRRILELRAIGGAKERVFAAMAEGLLNDSIKEFAAEIGLTHEATYRALSELAEAGLITKVGRGKYLVDLTG